MEHQGDRINLRPESPELSLISLFRLAVKTKVADVGSVTAVEQRARIAKTRNPRGRSDTRGLATEGSVRQPELAAIWGSLALIEASP